jgi:hypothetical protein
MVDKLSLPRVDRPDRPRFAAAAAEDLLCGSRQLRVAFQQTAQRFAERDTPLMRAGASEPAAILIRSGFAYRSCTLPDGRCTILRILLSRDYAGLYHAVARITEFCQIYNVLRNRYEGRKLRLGTPGGS